MSNLSTLQTERGANGENFFFAAPATYALRYTMTGSVISVTLPDRLSSKTANANIGLAFASGGQRFFATVGKFDPLTGASTTPADPTLPTTDITDGTAPLDSPLNVITTPKSVLKLIGAAGVVVTVQVYL